MFLAHFCFGSMYLCKRYDLYISHSVCSLKSTDANCLLCVVSFFHLFDQMRRLRMWKMQLLDEHHLFIKYTSEDVVTLRVTDPSQVGT